VDGGEKMPKGSGGGRELMVFLKDRSGGSNDGEKWPKKRRSSRK